MTLATGQTVACDLVVGADGLKSKCRELYLGHADPPRDTGELAYRILIRASDMRKDPELARMAEVPTVGFWMGPRAHAVCYPLKGELFNIVLACPDNLPPGVDQQTADLGEMHAFFKTWDPRLQKLLGLVQHAFKWKLQVGLPPLLPCAAGRC